MANKSGFGDVPLAKQLAAAGTRFALNSYQQITSTNKVDNIFFSPISISTALSMVYLGARSHTADEMTSALQLADLGDNVHDAFSDFIQSVQNVDAQASGYILKTANRLFASNKYTFLPEYIDSCRKSYSADAVALDFHGDASGSRVTVNQWVEDQTEKKIVDLIPEGAINDLTMMILVNAIYFKGTWANQFDPRDTSAGKFYTDAETNVAANMMYLSSKLRSDQNDELDCKVVELPYGNERISMTIFLPNERMGITALEQKLNPELITKACKRMTGMYTVKLHLPKFKLQHQLMAKEMLQDLGMRDVFAEGKADLSGLDGTKNLHISDVVHKAFIDVNEEGSEAAASTGLMMSITSIPQYRDVKCDHPFIFVIRGNISGAILFMGRLMDPTK